MCIERKHVMLSMMILKQERESIYLRHSEISKKDGGICRIGFC